MVTSLPLDEVHAPEFLKDQKIWLVWKLEANGDKKPLKVPYYIDGTRRRGVQGSPEDTAAMSDFATAKKVAIAGNYAGLGIALSAATGFSAADFDDCVHDGVIVSEVRGTKEGTYAEYSPSGTGIHVFVTDALSNNKDNAKDGRWGIELFCTKGFLTFTGNTIPGSVPFANAANQHLTSIIDSRFPPRKEFIPMRELPDTIGMSLSSLSKLITNVDPDCDYHQWVRIGMALHHETDGSEEGFVLWDTWSANGTKYTSEEFNRKKWESFGNGGGPPVTGKSLIKLSGYAEPVDFEPIADLSPVSELVQNNRFNIVSDAEFCRNTVPITWLIDGFLPKASLGILYGDAGSGKSFLALDMCAAVARGVKWNGLRCKKNSRVLYVIAEGISGFPRRLNAYRAINNLGDAPIGIDIVESPILNMTETGNSKQFMKDLRSTDPYDLIVIDTLAQVTPGINESSSEDVTRVISICNQISAVSKAMVLIVHHSGKDATKGARGHSSLRGAADVMLEVNRDGDYRSVKVAKQKDGEETGEYGFKLVTVQLGFEELTPDDVEEGIAVGKEITSCYVEYCDVVKSEKKLGGIQQVIFDILKEANGAWKTQKEVIELCVEQLPVEEGVRDNRKYNVIRAIKSAVGKWIEENEGHEIRASITNFR